MEEEGLESSKSCQRSLWMLSYEVFYEVFYRNDCTILVTLNHLDMHRDCVFLKLTTRDAS